MADVFELSDPSPRSTSIFDSNDCCKNHSVDTLGEHKKW